MYIYCMSECLKVASAHISTLTNKYSFKFTNPLQFASQLLLQANYRQ